MFIFWDDKVIVNDHNLEFEAKFRYIFFIALSNFIFSSLISSSLPMVFLFFFFFFSFPHYCLTSCD